MRFHLLFETGAFPGWPIKMDEKVSNSGAVPERMLVSSPKVLKREVYEATREARDVVTLAQEKARLIIEDAERQREAILEQARQEGRAEGLAEWNHILATASQRADQLAKNWEETMLRLSVRVAEKIIGEQLRLHPETIVEIVRQVLKGARPGKHLTIQVNPAEAQQVRNRVDGLQGPGFSSEIEIVAAASVPSGGCVIESELGIIDARLETQLKCLEDALVRGVPAD
jgi:type III secretion protein L